MSNWTEDETNSDNTVAPGQAQEMSPAAYVRAARGQLKSNNKQEAYRILQAAKVLYPDEPMVLSYYGSLQAVVAKQYRAGVENCTRAITVLNGKAMLGEYLVLSEFYLNLGRAYLAAGMRVDAIKAFRKGLQYEKNNRAILKELKICDRRAKPPVPFFERSNLINKYFGLLLRRNLAR